MEGEIRIIPLGLLHKSQLRDRFARAGHNEKLAAYKAINELREAHSIWVKRSLINMARKIAIDLTRDVAPMTKSYQLNVAAIINEPDDALLKGLFSDLWAYMSPGLKQIATHAVAAVKKIKAKITPGKKMPEKDLSEIDAAVFNVMQQISASAQDMLTESGNLGIAAAEMVNQGIPQRDVQAMSYDEMKEWGDEHRRAKELQRQGISDDYAYAAAYASKNASEAIAVYDRDGRRSGKMYEAAREMFREQIRASLESEEGVSALRSRLIFPETWTDVEGHQRELADTLSPEELKLFSIAHLNRDWDRFAFHETQSAFQNGRLLRWGEMADMRPVYVEFRRAIGSKRERCPFCEANQGTKMRLFPSWAAFRNSPNYDGEDSLKDDNEADIAVWPGKSNVGRASADWWTCAPAHPYCVDDYVLV